MNNISPKKLLYSKWTALSPADKEKHFIIVKVEIDEDQIVTRCVLEALMSKRCVEIQWRSLKDKNKWSQGWK